MSQQELQKGFDALLKEQTLTMTAEVEESASLRGNYNIYFIAPMHTDLNDKKVLAIKDTFKTAGCILVAGMKKSTMGEVLFTLHGSNKNLKLGLEQFQVQKKLNRKSADMAYN